MNELNQSKIKCPNCEYEYYVGEIFDPKSFLGQPKEVERDFTGKIVYQEGTPQTLTETYICDKCNKQFKVTANISYKVTLDKELDMSEDYETAKYGDRIFLKEE